VFLFPHWYDELRQYEDYVEELFSAKSFAVHPNLFKYDEAVRYKEGQGQNILLTDRNQFSRYYKAIVAPDGIGAETTNDRNKTGPKKGRKSGEMHDICHRFNGTNGCSSSAEKCKYKHICKKCKQCGHGKMECKVDEGVWRAWEETSILEAQCVSQWIRILNSSWLTLLSMLTNLEGCWHIILTLLLSSPLSMVSATVSGHGPISE
jgi:hypothetical protein